jgi:hypothetical protein
MVRHLTGCIQAESQNIFLIRRELQVTWTETKFEYMTV